MKRVSYGLIMGYLLSLVLLCVIGKSLWIPAFIRAAYAALLIVWWLFYIYCFPSFFYKKAVRLTKRLGDNAMLIIANSIGAEYYILDMNKGQLMGLFALNPFRVQKMNVEEIKDVEIIVRSANKNVTDTVVCRLHLENKRHDIFIHRYTGITVNAGTEETDEILNYAYSVKEKLLSCKKMS